MTQGPPGGNTDDNNETVSIRRGDLPPGQPQYGQPPTGQYGQPPAGQYGQPPAGQYAPPPQSYGQSPQPYGAPTPPYHQPASGGRSVGVAALILALLGAVLAAVGFFAVRWTEIPALSDSLTQPKFLSLRKLFVALERLDTTDNGTFTIAYFKWAAFVLVGAALLFAILSALPTGATPVFRVLGVLVGLLSAAAALFVPALDEGSGLSRYLSGGFGLYLVAGGSVLMAVGALIGSRRRS